MKKALSIGLAGLFLFHILAHVLVCVGTWWQAEHDLSQRLQVYRSVDSLVEFQIPLSGQADGSATAPTTEDGFRYRGHYYSVVSLEIIHDTLHLVGLETRSRQFWSDDLLAFLDDHLNSADTGRKASQLLKFLLKEYSPNEYTVFHFDQCSWHESVQIPYTPVGAATRSAPIHSPPPQTVV